MREKRRGKVGEGRDGARSEGDSKDERERKVAEIERWR